MRGGWTAQPGASTDRGRRLTRAGWLGCAALLAGGCGAPVTPRITLEVPGGTLRSEHGDLVFSGRVRPGSALVALRGADGSVAQRPDGTFVVRLLALRPGLTTVRLSAGAARARLVRVRRGGRFGPPAREPQASRASGFGAPGALDATGGRVDLALLDFAPAPGRVTVRRGQIVSWHNLDHADHLLAFTGDAAGRPGLGRIGYDERATITPVRTGLLRYRCRLHPWLRGALDVR